tara:strand:+ start:2533 stop:3213 length:681 start_codon:yes stop_codon:yes gene_type:complete
MAANTPSLTEACERYGTDKGKRVHNYCQFYEKQFHGTNPKEILEIGIGNTAATGSGRSLQMWSSAYPAANVLGLDIEEKVVNRDYNLPELSGRINTKIADQTDGASLKRAAGHKNYDLILDDGLHQVSAQFNTLHSLWDHVKPCGKYVVEDLQSSFRPAAEAGADVKPTIVDVLSNPSMNSSPLLPEWDRMRKEIDHIDFYEGPAGKEKSYTAVIHKSCSISRAHH